MRGSEIGTVGEGEDRKRGKFKTLSKAQRSRKFKELWSSSQKNCLSDAKSFLSISPQSVSSCSNQHVVKLPKVVDKVVRSCKQSKKLSTKLSQVIDNRVVDNIVNKVISYVITSFNKVVKSQAVGFQSTSCRQTIIKLSARLPKQRIAMLFRLSFQCSFFSLKYNVTKNGFLYTDRRIGGKERTAGPKNAGMPCFHWDILLQATRVKIRIENTKTFHG